MSGQMQMNRMAWVAREIIPHEADLRAWLRRRVSGDGVDDIIQESYARIAALDSFAHIRNGRAYFFTAARQLLIEQIRRSKIVQMEAMSDTDWNRLCQESPSPEQICAGRNELATVKRLIEQLPGRCRQIFELRKIHGLSQREVAQHLRVSEHVVENDVAKGLRLLMAAVASGRGPSTAKSNEKDDVSKSHKNQRD